MFDGKFICTLLALVVAVVAICNFDTKKKDILEGLGMLPGRTVRHEKVAMLGSGSPYKGAVYSVPGTYQAQLSPRMSGGIGYGANIRYNPPAMLNQAVPCDPVRGCGSSSDGSSAVNNPMVYAAMTKENYAGSGCGSCAGGCFAADCGKGGAPKSFRAPPPGISDYANGNYNEQVAAANESNGTAATLTEVPVGNMTTLNAQGETEHPIVFDRLMFANRNSTLRSQGDWIRGDLPIVPCNTGWFQVSVDPNIDLNQGAMNVLGGLGNETTQQLTALINNTSNSTTVAGMNLTTNELSSIGAGMNDLQVTAIA